MSLRSTKTRDRDSTATKAPSTLAGNEKDGDHRAGPTAFSGMFEAPVAGARPTPPAKLTAEQETKLAEMLKYFRSRETYPTSLKSDGADEEPPSDWEKLRMLSRESMLRYLRATRWDVTQAKKRLVDTIAWRREFGVDSIDAAHVEPEARSGKETVLGFDNSARPLHYMHPHRNDTKETPRQMQFAVWILERCIDMMPPGVEQLALLINFDSKSRNPTSIANAKLMLYILQNHYVERLGVALCINVPWVFKAFWSAIQAFIDPVTKSKCKFDEDIKSEVPAEQLSKDFGGSLGPEYKHDQYWAELVRVCDSRREKMLQRFKEQCGSEIGASEWVIRGGNDKELDDVPLANQDIKDIADEAPDRAALARTTSNKPATAPTTQVTDPQGANDGLEARREAVTASRSRTEAATAATSGTTANGSHEEREPSKLPNGHLDDSAPENQLAANGAPTTPFEAFKTPSGTVASDPIDRHFSEVGTGAVAAGAAGAEATSAPSLNGQPDNKAQKAHHPDGQGFQAFMSRIVHHDDDGKAHPNDVQTDSSKDSIKLLLFAAARDAAGKSSIVVSLPKTPYPLSDISSLLATLEMKDGKRFNEVLDRSQWSVDESMVSADEISKKMLKGGEEVAVIPPVSGG
ncbi:unnamed protein product [Parajaminaea phylloscopi]